MSPALLLLLLLALQLLLLLLLLLLAMVVVRRFCASGHYMDATATTECLLMPTTHSCSFTAF